MLRATSLSGAVVGRSRPVSETKRERFKRLGRRRVLKVLSALRLVGNLSATSSYSYTPDDVKLMHFLITQATERAFKRFARPRHVEISFAFPDEVTAAQAEWAEPASPDNDGSVPLPSGPLGALSRSERRLRDLEAIRRAAASQTTPQRARRLQVRDPETVPAASRPDRRAATVAKMSQRRNSSTKG